MYIDSYMFSMVMLWRHLYLLVLFTDLFKACKIVTMKILLSSSIWFRGGGGIQNIIQGECGLAARGVRSPGGRNPELYGLYFLMWAKR
jgi:hypothetical protein